jgi:oligoendopeptidase F
MAERRWIDAREGSARAGGAYCTSFAKSRSPRVYLSAYTGSAYWISTLAHELGHA